jgi:hypothetical protein
MNNAGWGGERPPTVKDRRNRATLALGEQSVFGLIVWPEGQFAVTSILIGLVVFRTTFNTVNDVF